MELYSDDFLLHLSDEVKLLYKAKKHGRRLILVICTNLKVDRIEKRIKTEVRKEEEGVEGYR